MEVIFDSDRFIMITLDVKRVSTVQYSTVQYSTVQYSTVQHSTVQHSTDLDALTLKLVTKTVAKPILHVLNM